MCLDAIRCPRKFRADSFLPQMPDADGAAIADTDSLEAVAKLTRTNRYRDVMRRVRAALEAGADAEEEQAWTGPSEESPTYRRYPASWADREPDPDPDPDSDCICSDSLGILFP